MMYLCQYTRNAIINHAGIIKSHENLRNRITYSYSKYIIHVHENIKTCNNYIYEVMK